MATTVQTQTSAAAASEQETIKAIEKKLSGLSSIMEGFKNGMAEFAKVMTDENSQFFRNMSNVMFGSMLDSMQRRDSQRRLDEEARAQNEETRKMAMGDRGPERGQAGFWEAAFASVPEKPEDVHAKATVRALTSREVRKQLEEAFSTATIRAAVREGDSRSFGEKTLDFIGLGFVNKLGNWFKDRDIRKVEKANRKDQGLIARSMKERSRLEARVRSRREAGATEDEIETLMSSLRGIGDRIKDAEARIESRKTPVDPYGYMAETAYGNRGEAEQGRLPNTVQVGPASDRNVPQLPENAGKLTVDDAKTLGEYYAKLEASMKNPSYPAGAKVAGDGAADKDSAGLAMGRLPYQPGESAGGYREIPGVDEREAADIERRLDTRLRPEFYQEGIAFFKKANRGEISFGGTQSSGGMGKNGLFATTVGAALGAIVLAAKNSYDLAKMNLEHVDDLKDKVEKDYKEIEDRRIRGWNDAEIDAELTEREARFRRDLYSSNAYELPNEVQEHRKAATQYILDRSPMLRWIMEKRGYQVKDTDLEIANSDAFAAQNNYASAATEQRELERAAKAAGVDFNDTAALVAFRQSYYKDSTPVATAGNTEQKTEATATTPAGTVDEGKVESATEKNMRDEEAMYNAMKRALTDYEVQMYELENTKTAIRELDTALTGRK